MDQGRRELMAALAAVAAGVSAGTAMRAAQAQEGWPNRPIRIISPGAAGGGSDIFVRIVEPRVREKLGQPLFIENRPGAGGMVGASAANTATPDGYTFFVSNVATNGIGVTLYRKPSFNPKTDLPAVARFATMSNAVAVRADRGIGSMADLVAYLKANPDKANFGSAGSGTTSHLSAVMLGQRIGVPLTHIPYKGTAANLTGLLAGDVLFSIDNLPLYTPHVKAGTLKLLAVTAPQRVSHQPDVPTLQEAGFPGFDVTSWYGLSAATGTPAAIIDRMGAEIVAALGDPAIAAKVRDVGAEPAPLGPKAYATFIDDEIRKWAPIISASGAQVD